MYVAVCKETTINLRKSESVDSSNPPVRSRSVTSRDNEMTTSTNAAHHSHSATDWLKLIEIFEIVLLKY